MIELTLGGIPPVNCWIRFWKAVLKKSGIILMGRKETNLDPTQMLEIALICFLIRVQKEVNHRHFFGNAHS